MVKMLPIYINIGIHFLWISLCKQNLKHIACKIALHEYNPNPQKYVPSLHLKSQLRLRPSVKFQMHILAPSDKRLPMHVLVFRSHRAIIEYKTRIKHQEETWGNRRKRLIQSTTRNFF